MNTDSKIGFGIYLGKTIADIPESYFLYLYKQMWFQKSELSHISELREYIKKTLYDNKK